MISSNAILVPLFGIALIPKLEVIINVSILFQPIGDLEIPKEENGIEKNFQPT